MVRRTYKYRAYLNRGTCRRARNAMRRAATPVWNACVAEREAVRNAYRARCKEVGAERPMERRVIAKEFDWPTAYDQYKHCRKRDHPEYALYHAKMLECVVAKVDGSEKSFLALWQKGDHDARPPKKTKMHRCLTWRCSGWKIDGHHVSFAGVGRVRMRLHRPIDGRVKTASLTCEHGKWYVHFSVELDEPRKQRRGHGAVTVQFPDGRVFLTDNHGRIVRQPEFYQGNLPAVRRLSRALSRKQAGSRNRRKAKKTLARHHAKIARRRRYFLWGLANEYARQYRKITVMVRPVKPRIQYDLTSDIARDLCDGAYAMFMIMLKQECQEDGTDLILKETKKWQSDKDLAARIQAIEATVATWRRAKKLLQRERLAV